MKYLPDMVVGVIVIGVAAYWLDALPPGQESSAFKTTLAFVMAVAGLWVIIHLLAAVAERFPRKTDD